MQATDSTGKIWYLNSTRGLAPNVIPEYGNHICEHFVSLKSICWPGPTGAADAGDNGNRVCSYVNNSSIGLHMGILMFVVYVLNELVGLLGFAAAVEVYPWKEERIQVLAIGVVWAILAVIGWVILWSDVTANSELTTRPNGAIANRNQIGLLAAVLMSIGLAASWPWRDGRQAKATDTKPTNVLTEVKELMCDPKNPVVGAVKLYFCAVTLYAMQNQMRLLSGIYIFMYVLQMPPEMAAPAIASAASAGLAVRILFTILWGGYYGSKLLFVIFRICVAAAVVIFVTNFFML